MPQSNKSKKSGGAKKPAQAAAPPAARFETYRPFIDRLLFGVALLGVLVVVHLWIQAGRGFEGGCIGAAELLKSSDCAAVVQSEAGKLFGISNVMWGLLFYVAVAAMSFAVAFVKGATLQRLKQARAGLIAFGFVYSAYLVGVQYFQIGQFCALCLASAALATLLFGIQVYAVFKPEASFDMKAPKWKREPALLGALLVATLVLAGADVAYFNRLDQAEQEPPSPSIAEAGSVAPATSAEAIPPVPQVDARVAQQNECTFNSEIPPVENYEALFDISDPYLGTYEASVTVIEYFDLNCPHCKSLHPLMKRIIEENSQRARFYILPFVISEPSLYQTEALYVAGQEGKYFEMLDAQFDNQKPGGLSVDELRPLATALGMNADQMASRVERGLYRQQILRRRQQIIDIGVNAVPTVFINGRAISSSARTPACLNQLITDAAVGG